MCRVSVPSLKNDILPGGVDLWCHNDVASSKNKEKKGLDQRKTEIKAKEDTIYANVGHSTTDITT